MSSVSSTMEPCACASMFIWHIYIQADVEKKTKLGHCLKFNVKDFTSKMFYGGSMSL